MEKMAIGSDYERDGDTSRSSSDCETVSSFSMYT